MTRELFNLPDVGEGLTEAEIVAWRVAPGDTIEVNDVIVEIETAKAAVELPSPWAGTVGELLAEPGATIEVGSPIIAIDTPGSDRSSAGSPAEEAGAKIGEAGKDGRIATLVGYGPRQGSVRRRPRRGAGAPAGEPAQPVPAEPAPPQSVPAQPASAQPVPAQPVPAEPASAQQDVPAGVAAAAVGPGEAAEHRAEVPGAAPSGDPEPGAATGATGPAAAQVPLAPPPVRLVARELGVDLRTVTGTGPHGRITRDDVHATANGSPGSVSGAPAQGPGPAAADAGSAAAAAAGAVGTVGAAGGAGAARPAGVSGSTGAAAGVRAATAATAGASAATTGVPAATGGAAGAPAAAAGPAADAGPGTTPAPAGSGDRREPIRGVRKATAAAMVASAFTAPHVTEFLSVDATEMMALRERLRASREFAGVKLTPLAFVAKAACLAAARTPAVNAAWDERAGEIVYYERVQLGIAAATPRGLLVPKIRDADRLALRPMAEALSELTETARAGRTAPADLVGGTFTITNVGALGVDTGTPILNPGESAILAVGSIKQAPWVVDGELAVRTVCRLALSFDHRVVDGAEGSRFLADVGALLADPGIALTW
ncbi:MULTISPECIES: dihydrolipoamide acetyltransferase family protein [Pseudonocardia]|uniref:Dihydrolipoamide acetyltransferase component of pyruvate dehydrogenase complex n=2 Tax=Pseudonocardia TaxID=1847 RepID=A0A1Y2MP53_PSEAH|nr:MULTISPECIES: dihydrolipoamide acetyltransferase family protein [Pseudonocardia]OSY36467.1 Dihydrolipoyllysine-residue acetyltransferase component of pyruvate dehydrogenase complex [Pseudonocardia autotrophica]TDN74759.1 pyruvate dehydrogenase E2 component (dihydrolipoamide acetyltransferase) [Pseudonocardia autotrophica]BBG05534.1 hypothetical protein Pdca_67430 [Pseudonocardia autotrophica]GEC29049.1 hypothetical protein PSA01_60780 [Pseudonocardia saturnea]